VLPFRTILVRSMYNRTGVSSRPDVGRACILDGRPEPKRSPGVGKGLVWPSSSRGPPRVPRLRPGSTPIGLLSALLCLTFLKLDTLSSYFNSGMFALTVTIPCTMDVATRTPVLSSRRCTSGSSHPAPGGLWTSPAAAPRVNGKGPRCVPSRSRGPIEPSS